MNDNFNATSAFSLSLPLFLSLCDKFIQREISVRDVQRFPGFQPELNICRILTIECLWLAFNVLTDTLRGNLVKYIIDSGFWTSKGEKLGTYFII